MDLVSQNRELVRNSTESGDDEDADEALYDQMGHVMKRRLELNREFILIEGLYFDGSTSPKQAEEYAGRVLNCKLSTDPTQRNRNRKHYDCRQGRHSDCEFRVLAASSTAITEKSRNGGAPEWTRTWLYFSVEKDGGKTQLLLKYFSATK